MGGSELDTDAQIESVAALRDPLRRAIYRHVVKRAEPVGRDDVAAAVGISRSLAAFHLDKLVAERLLETSYRRLSGRTGPGAGRPAKLYARADRQLEISLPAREYELAARLLLRAVEGLDEAKLQASLRTAAHELGESRGAGNVAALGAPRGRHAALERLEAILDELGYEPFQDEQSLCLRNCPFHALAQQSTATVCDMNLALLEGVLEGLRAKGLLAELAPAAGRCCVAVRPVPVSRSAAGDG